MIILFRKSHGSPCGLALAPCGTGCRAFSGPDPSRLSSSLSQSKINRLNSLPIISFPAFITYQTFFGAAERFADIPLRIVIIVSYTRQTHRFPASAALKEKLQVKFAAHFHADIALHFHNELPTHPHRPTQNFIKKNYPFFHHEDTKLTEFIKFFFIIFYLLRVLRALCG